MDCFEYQSLISAQLDGDISPAEVVEVKEHLNSCPRCAGLYADLRAIVSEASELPLFEPEPHVWNRLRSQCVSEGLIHDQPLTRAWWSWFRPLDWQLASATATMALLVMVASFWVYRGLHVTPGPLSMTTQEALATNEVRVAEQNYLQAINSLQKISEAQMAQMDPSVKGILEDNLATIDYYIDKCRETVKNEPSNALAQRYLLEAYRKKVDLLASIVHSDVL